MEGTSHERQDTDTHDLEQLLWEHTHIFQNPVHVLLPPCSRDHFNELHGGKYFSKLDLK